jgi:hypothetical protein
VEPLFRGKAISITYSECVFVALVIQHAKRMCHSAICGLSGSTIFFHTISEKKVLNIKCVFCFPLQILSETFLILRRIERDITINVFGLHVKHPLFLSDFNESRMFPTDFRKIFKY